MDINFKGLVDLHNMPSSEPLLPLFEAIVNSIQSINQANIKDGKISVRIEREKTAEKTPNFFNLSDWETDIENITITDNGVGFNEDNYKSFDTYASDFKKMLGCKGVGRMIWLKAFDNVEVESTYVENEVHKKRTFNFDSDNAISNNIVTDSDISPNNSTIVRLVGLKSKNKTNTPKKLATIARDILNHCFIYFVLDKAPQILSLMTMIVLT